MRIRAYLSALAQPPLPTLIAVSLSAWLALLLSGHGLHAPGHLAGFPAVLQAGRSWFLMLAAMMPPMLAGAVQHVWISSLPRRRGRAVLVFFVGYTAVWMLAGAGLIFSAGQLAAFSAGWPAAPVIVLLSAAAWQASPWKQVCLNHCHVQPRLSPFGLAADRDSLSFGLVKGFWCLGSCWALMALPLVFAQAELFVMLAVCLILIGEQFRPGRRARWRVPILGAMFG